MDRRELDTLGVAEWSAIESGFTEADLFLGNGFSLNIWSYFKYGSLFDQFLRACEESEQRIFSRFGTTNFEFILEELANAEKVNRIFGIGTEDITDAINKVRTGLIRTIHDIHPMASELNWTKLDQLTSQLEPFNDIYTVNYDALIYHIIMLCKDRYDAGLSRSRYNDYYWKRASSRYLQFMDYQIYTPYKHVYYLHGALFLFRGSYEDLKVRRSSDEEELLTLISGALQRGDLPLFVSEGNHRQKLKAISRSNYLRFCYDKLRLERERLVIYGTSLSPVQDQHIIDAIKGSTTEIAISIYPVGKSARQIKSETENFASRFPSHHLRFFDATTLFQIH